MALNLASPGIVVREVDLTVGRVGPTSNKIGAIVSPFAKGPVDSPTLVETEQDLLNNFGEPYATDKHYEHWLTASSYLAYGGSLRVVRADDTDLKNGFAGTLVGAATSIKIKSLDHYAELGYDENAITGVTVAARNPGSWSNGIRVAIIDSKADQIIGITTGTTTFSGIATSSCVVGVTTTILTGVTTTSIAVGQYVQPFTGVIGSGTTVTSIGVGTVYIGTASINSTQVTTSLSFGTYTSSGSIQVGFGITQSATGKVAAGAAGTSLLDGYFKGIVTEVGEGKVSVKLLNHVSTAGTIRNVDYQPNSIYAFETGSTYGSLYLTNNSSTGVATVTATTALDWFDQQTLTVGTGFVGTASTEIKINWNNIADRPFTSDYANSRGARFDEVHVVIIDALGTITGNAGTILEKHLNLSKASDAQFSVGSPSYWRKYIENGSEYIFGGSATSLGITSTSFSSGFTLATDNGWDQEADGITFGACGAKDLILTRGVDYNGYAGITSTGALTATVGKISEGYDLFENSDNFKVDFLLMGSANYNIYDAQALAEKLISVAELRKDAVAFISPYRGAALTDTSTDTEVTVRSDADITDKVLQFYAPITSSTYAIFDSGYKYMYDRFSDTFRYVPLNGDIAGTCARNDINNFAWYSPAGTSRGAILNAVKLAYNPSKSQRDRLYSSRINPVIFSPGAGIVLFGDKTGYGKASAFDRINVRRLFIYLETAISTAAKDQLFEFNDEITRTNFVNIVEPFLRDVQAKRGIYDYVVVCDETNNTAAVIDSNEFVADIYIKPARSINFIGLTFVATRTGVSFDEVIGQF
jgi:hypothetical protein